MKIEELITKSSWTPDHINALSYEGYNFLLSNNFDSALSCLYISHHLNPKDWYAATLLGIVYYSLKKYKYSLYYLDLALKNSKSQEDSDFVSLHKMLGEYLSQNLDKSKNTAKSLVNSNNQMISNFAKGLQEIINRKT